jgi:DNA polymerase-3 subunit alpha
LQAAAEQQNDRRKGQRSLFETVGTDDEPLPSQPLPDVPEWPDAEKLKYEKEALDFYLSSHPLVQYEEEIHRFATCTVNQVARCAPGQEVIIGGMLTGIRFQMTKKMTRYARLNVEDLTGVIECVMWSDDLARHKDDVVEDRICFVKGTIDTRSTREERTLVLNRVMSVEAARRELTRGLWLKLTLGEHEPTVIDAIGRVLKRTPGTCWVFMSIHDAAGKSVRLKLGEDFRVNPQSVAVGELETLLGAGCVKFAGTSGRSGKG